MSKGKAYVFLVPGTSETHEGSTPLPPLGMTKNVADLLPANLNGTQIICHSVPYTSGYGDRASYLNSVNNGKGTLLSFIRDLEPEDLVFLVGYSQGATIAGDIARDWEMQTGKEGLDYPIFMGYYGLADPRRNHDQIVGPDPGGAGITGERGYMGTSGALTYQFCIPGDIIASSDPSQDLFMEISEFTNHFWIGDVISWVGYSLALLNSSEFQKQLRKRYPGLLGLIRFKRKLNRTIERGVKYLVSGVHMKYDTYELDASGTTPMGWIADDIVNKIKELQ